MENAFLSGKRALVTGSTSGVGLGIAEAFAAAGVNVILSGLGTREQIDSAIARVRKAGALDTYLLPGDLSDPNAIDAMMDEALSSDLDILVNNAGMQYIAPVHEMPVEKWQKIIAINLSACFYTTRRALPQMILRKYGRIINVASAHGLIASVGKAPYVASKFGLVGFTKATALECAEVGDRDSGGVTVNAICPGWVETPLIQPQIMRKAEMFNGDYQAGARALVSEKQPSQRLSLPEDIGALALFLCGRHAHNITGSALPVDGGWTAQ